MSITYAHVNNVGEEPRAYEREQERPHKHRREEEHGRQADGRDRSK